MLYFRISDTSDISYARRKITELAHTLNLPSIDIANIALVVTEMGTNMLKHAVRGELLAQEVAPNQAQGLDLWALDSGPGMGKVSECLRDGYSTAGSPGTGLGAIVRLSTLSEIFTLPGIGTVVFARLMVRPTPQQSRPMSFELPGGSTRARFTTGVVSVAKSDQPVCGDGWAVSQSPQRYRLMVADGIGHGPAAAQAVESAITVFHQRVAASLSDVLGAIHLALRATRGAVVAVAEIRPAEQSLSYCGVGNISATLLTTQGTRSLVSLNGVVGHHLPTLKTFSYDWTPQTLLVMHSDGLSSRWSLERYPGLLMRHPSVIAGVLYRDFHRGGRDDVTVAAVKATEEEP